MDGADEPDGNGKVRVLPAQADRVETGAVRFGDDWPGLWIRGDDAFQLLTSLKILLGQPGHRDATEVEKVAALGTVIAYMVVIDLKVIQK